jgi:predicted ABC-type ATPase
LEGGHNVPEAVVRRRYRRSVKNFLRVYRSEVYSWTLFDNSCAAPAIIAIEKQRKLHIINGELYNALIRQYGAV